MATQVVKEQGRFDAAFRALQEQAGAAWLKSLRENALDQFAQQGFPTTDEEEWKYTNLAPIAKTDFTPSAEAFESEHLSADELEPFIYDEAKQSRLVFVNGVFNSELSSLEALPAGVVAADLSAAFDGERSESARKFLARAADYKDSSLVALNTAFISMGAFIFIPRGVRVGSPIHLLFLSIQQETPAVSFPRVLVIAERGSEATIIESYASTRDGAYWTNAVVEIFLEDEARLNLYKVQRESTESFHTATTSAHLARASSLNATTITLGAALSRHDIKVTLDADGAECWVDGLYLVGDGQHTDTHSLIDHRAPFCTSHQLYKGILDGKSRAVFNGKIFVRHEAPKTDAMQTNKNLLLSNEARVDTKPQLEIFNDDVKCAHGAAIGQLDEEELFYLESRGMRPELARNLLTYGFAEEVIDKLKIESIKAELDRAVLNRLHANLEV